MGQDGLRIGLIGLGSMGRHHARVIRATPGMELVAVADPGGDRFGVAGELLTTADISALVNLACTAEAFAEAAPWVETMSCAKPITVAL